MQFLMGLVAIAIVLIMIGTAIYDAIKKHKK